MVTIHGVGVLGIQGAVSEHICLLRQAVHKKETSIDVLTVRSLKHLARVDGLVIPGGESTTISRILKSSGLYEEIVRRVQQENLSLLGTCAGSVLLAKQLKNPRADIHLLELMDIKVQRNAFGRQKESFEYDIDFNQLNRPFPAVFIRAPIITETWGSCKTLARLEQTIIAAQQKNLIACVFHPELTKDSRIHEYFLDTIF